MTAWLTRVNTRTGWQLGERGLTATKSSMGRGSAMQGRNQQLVSLSKTQEQYGRTESLIREWLFRFGIEHKEDVAARVPLWIEAFRGMDPNVLNGLFVRAFRTLKWFPKVSEILSP